MAAKLDATTLLLCSCEGTMTLDAAGIAHACGAGRAQAGTQLCRSELKGFLAAAGKAESLMVGCTQEAPTFEAALDEAQIDVPATFVNIRERAGWSHEGAAAAPKMAALIAAAAELAEPPPQVTLESNGVLLVLGKDQVALDAAMKLEDRLDVTVLLAAADDLIPPRRWDVPVRKGKVRTAKGHLGAFELVIDGYAEPAPSSRSSYVFGPGRNGLTSTPDIVLDLTGGPALFPAADLRPGYLRADPADPVAVAAALFAAADLTGTFDKPRYITFHEDLCAHSRSKKTGCTRCLELCPTGAISPAGDHVAIDPAVCAGCGQCAAACPTGAAEYAVPPAEILLAKLRAILTTYARAGGTRPVLLIHDEDHGAALIDAAARFSEGLPASVIPVEVNEVTQIGLEAIAAAFAHGAAGIVVLTRAKPKHDLLGLERTLALADTALAALGYGAGGARLLSTDDPDAMLAALAASPATTVAPEPSSFAARGPKRSVLNLAMRELHRVAPAPVDTVALPAGAPFGTLNIDVNGCTLCLSCVSACPTKALGDDPDRPMLTFKEDACVQCGLCAATCPEKVISLEPRLNFLAFNAPPQVVKTEEPFACIACSKPFGTRSTIEKIAAKLAGKHWMYSGEMSRRIDLVKMCDTCRIEAVTNAGFDPYAAPRPAPRTTEDYLREREAEGEQKH